MQAMIMWSVPFFVVMGTCGMAFFYSILIVAMWNDEKRCAWLGQTFAVSVFVWVILVIAAGRLGLFQ